MKKLLFLFTILLLTACSGDGFVKVSNIEQLNGKWKSGDDTLYINSSESILQFNDGAVQIFTFEDDGFNFFINGYIGDFESFAASFEIKENLIRVNRIDGGVDLTYIKQ